MLPFPSIEVNSPTLMWIAGVLFIFVATLSYLYYRKTLPPVPKFKRVLLSVFRTGALGVILFLLLDPVLRLALVTHHPPVIAILSDRSASMNIVDRSGKRADQMQTLLTTQLPQAIPRRSEARYYSFGASLRGPLRFPFDSIGDEITDIAGALQALARERNRLNIRAVVMISDGVYTVGENPIHDTEVLNVPIFTIGVGDTNEQKDILVARISANEVVYSGTKVPIDVTIKSTGYGGQRAEVTLREGSQILDRTLITLPAGTAEVEAQLTYVPKGEGLHRYAVQVSSMPGELTTTNNRRSFSVRILRSAIRVLIVASGPTPDLSMIRQTLIEDKNIYVRTRTQKFPNGFYEDPLGRSDFDSSDCIITIGMPNSVTATSTITFIRDAITVQHTPVFIVAGKDLDYSRLSAMAPSSPFSVDATTSTEEELEFTLDPSHTDHPLLKLAPLRGSDAWNHLPPVFATRAIYQPREGTVVLGLLTRHDSAHPQAILALRNLGGTKSIAFMGYGIWRWRLMALANAETASLMSSFLSSAVRWLTSRNEGRTVRVAPIKDQFSSGEPIAFTAQVYDANNMEPLDDARVHINISGGGQTFETDLHPTGSGRYEGILNGLTEGEFAFKGLASRDGTSLGQDGGTFTVGGLNLEFLDTRLNADLLRQLAHRTGGKYFPADNVSHLQEDLDSLRALSPLEQRTALTYPLQRWFLVLALLVLLLTAEWAIRKRSGML